MISWIQTYFPFPKKVTYVRNDKELECYFNYRKHVDMKKICDRLLKIDDEIFYNALAIFSRNHYKYRDILYYNLQTINVEQRYGEDTVGSYILDKGFNDLTYENEDDVYHELLHAASTYYDEKNELFYSGFAYVKDNKNLVGEGITEGYVELVSGRDCGNDRVIKDLNGSLNDLSTNSPYVYNNVLARQLEIIVGKEELESMFFKDGFNRLKTFLMQYKSEKEVMRFFSDSDAASLASAANSRILNKRVLKAQEFLFDIAREHMADKIDILEYDRLRPSDNKGMRCLTSRRIRTEIIEVISKSDKRK